VGKRWVGKKVGNWWVNGGSNVGKHGVGTNVGNWLYRWVTGG
jgi:hypothetical protein